MSHMWIEVFAFFECFLFFIYLFIFVFVLSDIRVETIKRTQAIREDMIQKEQSEKEAELIRRQTQAEKMIS